MTFTPTADSKIHNAICNFCELFIDNTAIVCTTHPMLANTVIAEVHGEVDDPMSHAAGMPHITARGVWFTVALTNVLGDDPIAVTLVNNRTDVDPRD